MLTKEFAAVITGAVQQIKVKTDLRAGRWSCRDCQGQVSGNQMTQVTCASCQTILSGAIFVGREIL